MIERIHNHNLVGYKWIFKLKPWIPCVEDKRYKARLVAKGFSHGIDYNEILISLKLH